jgi:superfamily I DNA/RNA helicase
MDEVELGRRAAEKLHQQLAATGHDPWQPLEFVKAEAKRRDVVVEEASKGAAILNGGRATYSHKYGVILYESGCSDFESAFLIAHEIGHIELGDDVDEDTSSPPSSIDLTRSVETSPVGVARVADYGRKQRREVQMDLFAREFLLPRSVVRRLHLEEGMTATEIAKKLDAPFAVVVQQLLDALLLPVMVESPKKQRENKNNAIQLSAVRHRGMPYMLEAGPGTGKTQTLIARLLSLLDEGVDPRRILALTFSNKAAGEIAQRIAEVNPAATAAMWIGTFHAFGLDLLRRFYQMLDLPPDPRMLDRTESVELLENEFPRLGLQHYRDIYDPTDIISDILSAISRAKDEVVDADTYQKLAENMLAKASSTEETIAAEQALEVAQVYHAYEKIKHDQKAIDFGDLVCRPVQLLEINKVVRETLQRTYDHVLVDEYQDVNRSSVRLLKALCGDGHNLWVVGDAKQSIYRFRGASSYNMHRFDKEDFPGGVRERLRHNYRSVEEIVSTFSSFAVGMAVGDQDSSLESDRKLCGHAVQLRKVRLGEQQAPAIADAIEEMRDASYSYRDQAVLCTGNEKLSEYAKTLERMGIPVLFLGNLFERPEVKDLLCIISLIVDRRAMGLAKVGCLDGYNMSLDDVAAIMSHLKEHEYDAWQWKTIASKLECLSDSGKATLDKLAILLDGFNEDANPWTALATILLDRTRMAAQLAQSTTVADQGRAIAIWQLMNFVRTQPARQGLPITRLLNRIRRLVRLGDDRDLRQLPAAAQNINGVRLVTIHGAKGLEFPVVHLPGMNVNTLPRTVPQSDCPPPIGMIEGAMDDAKALHKLENDQEQECLFYVALSRARDRLFMYAATQLSNGNNRPVSRFIDQLKGLITIQEFQPAREVPPVPEDSDIQLLIEGNMSFSGQEISLYDSCPRRFFYTYLLQVGGKRVSTPFVQMHDTVRTVFQSAVQGSIAPGMTLAEHLVQTFASSGLAEHGYAPEYLDLANSMIEFFASVRDGFQVEKPVGLKLNFGGEEITVWPDDILVDAHGKRTVRRISTGHQRKSDMKKISTATFLLAVQKALPGADVELVYLSDQVIQPVHISAKQLSAADATLTTSLQDIRQGIFKAAPSNKKRCPGCPSFFTCGSVPSGSLTKRF